MCRLSFFLHAFVLIFYNDKVLQVFLLLIGFFFFLGATPKGKSPQEAAPNHSPLFDFDEDAMAVGAQALAALALDQLARTA